MTHYELLVAEMSPACDTGGIVLSAPPPDDRRTNRRIPIDQPVTWVRYSHGSSVGETGIGRTVNISSHGLWFTPDNLLLTGMKLELSIDWPVLLNDSSPMKLMVSGRVVRCNREGVALMIERYSFHTRKRNRPAIMKASRKVG